MTLKTDIAHAIMMKQAEGIHIPYEEVAEAVIKALTIGHPSEIGEKFSTLQKLVDELPNYDGITIRALSHGFAQETLDLISKLLAESLGRPPAPDGISATLIPVIHAEFETSGGGLTGKQAAKVKRIEHQDDGSLTVVIDHWPNVASPAIPDDPMLRLGLALKDALPNVTDPGWFDLSAKIRNDGVDFYINDLTVVPRGTQKRTDLSARMRELAASVSHQNGDFASVRKTDLLALAEEADRYYTAMVNWKATAEAKDRVAVLDKARESLAAPDPKLKELRMSEMTLEQQDDALELWLRDNLGWFRFQTHDHIKFLLDRLAKTRREAMEIKAIYDDLQGVKETVNLVQAERQKLQDELANVTAERDAYRSQSATRLEEIEKFLQQRQELEKTNQELRNERNTAMAESRDANHKLAAARRALGDDNG